MNRYNNTQIIKRFDGKRMYSTTYYPQIPLHETDIYMIAKSTTMLDSLAYQYYKDSSLWWVIYKANSLRGGGVGVTTGTQLRIPINIQPILESFNRINK